MALLLSEEIVEFVESGVSVLVGSRNAEMRPECIRGFGATVSKDRSRLAVYLTAELATRMRADLEENGRVAIAFSRFVDHKTLQLKGRVVALRAGTPDDHAAQQRYIAAFGEHLSIAGLPRSILRRVRLGTLLVVDLDVEEIYLQTPGPDAGRRLEPRA
jgi:hypothetical protein